MRPDEFELGVCWSCQTELSHDSVVLLDSQTAIQCCRECWGKIDVADRVQTALLFHDRTDAGLGIADATHAIVGVVETIIRHYIHQSRFSNGKSDGGQDWSGLN